MSVGLLLQIDFEQFLKLQAAQLVVADMNYIMGLFPK